MHPMLVYVCNVSRVCWHCSQGLRSGEGGTSVRKKDVTEGLKDKSCFWPPIMTHQTVYVCVFVRLCVCLCGCSRDFFVCICTGLKFVCVCVCECVCFVLFQPQLESQQCLITAVLRNNGSHGSPTLHTQTHTISCSITHTHVQNSFACLSLTWTSFLARKHTYSYTIPLPAPHSWAWGSSRGIWASRPAASLSSTCQAEQKLPPSLDRWQCLPILSFPSSTTVFFSPVNTIICSFLTGFCRAQWGAAIGDRCLSSM